MADNIDITPGSGKTVATDEVTIDGAAAHVQRVKPIHGVAGAGVDVSASNPLPTTNTADETDTGTIVANGGVVNTAVLDGMVGWVMSYYGTYATGASLVMEVSFDGGTTYVTTRMLAGTTSTLGYVLTIAAGVNGINWFTADIPAGATNLQVRCSAWAAPTGTINVIIGQSKTRNITPAGAIVLTSGTVTTVTTLTTLTGITNWGNVVDNGAFVDGTTRLLPSGYIYDEVAGTALTENDAAAARINVNRAQVQAIEDGTTRGRYLVVTAANAAKVDGSAVTQPVSGDVDVTTVGTITPGTAATSLGKAEDVAAASGDTGIAAFGVRNDALTAAQTNATGDYGSFSLDTSGIQIVAGAPRLLKARQVTIITSSTTETTIVTAIASTFNDLYGLVLSNTSATATEVTVRDATAGGTISSFMVPAGETRGFMLPLDSAVPQATANNNWTATCGTSVASLKVTALYVKRV